MAGNSFGRLLRLTTFGESHGPCLGGVLDGCPAGLALDTAYIQSRLDQRRPGQQGLASTSRREADSVELLSGVLDGQTTGTSIGFRIANTDQHSKDYTALARLFRPGHADWGYHQKYLGIRDVRGGGRASGRETAARVVGGAIAEQILARWGISIVAGTIELGGIAVPPAAHALETAAQRPYFAASETILKDWDKLLHEVHQAGDSVGGIVQIEARGVPAGLGEPVFDKLDATLAQALMSVGAVKGVEVGEGFAAARLRGSENNDALLPQPPAGSPEPATARSAVDSPAEAGSGRVQRHTPDWTQPALQQVSFASNHAGGILGGISTGQDIVLRAAVKPIPSIALLQHSVDVTGQPVDVSVGGRHDRCAIPRIVPVLVAMTALALADALLVQARQGC